MGAAPLLLAMAMITADAGWETDGKGGYQYVIQVPAEQWDAVRREGSITSQIPENLRGRISAVKIRIGDGPIPRHEIVASSKIPTDFPPLPDTQPTVRAQNGTSGSAFQIPPPLAEAGQEVVDSFREQATNGMNDAARRAGQSFSDATNNFVDSATNQIRDAMGANGSTSSGPQAGGSMAGGPSTAPQPRSNATFGLGTSGRSAPPSTNPGPNPSSEFSPIVGSSPTSGTATTNSAGAPIPSGRSTPFNPPAGYSPTSPTGASASAGAPAPTGAFSATGTSAPAGTTAGSGSSGTGGTTGANNNPWGTQPTAQSNPYGSRSTTGQSQPATPSSPTYTDPTYPRTGTLAADPPSIGRNASLNASADMAMEKRLQAAEGDFKFDTRGLLIIDEPVLYVVGVLDEVGIDAATGRLFDKKTDVWIRENDPRYLRVIDFRNEYNAVTQERLASRGSTSGLSLTQPSTPTANPGYQPRTGIFDKPITTPQVGFGGTQPQTNFQSTTQDPAYLKGLELTLDDRVELAMLRKEKESATKLVGNPSSQQLPGSPLFGDQTTAGATAVGARSPSDEALDTKKSTTTKAKEIQPQPFLNFILLLSMVGNIYLAIAISRLIRRYRNLVASHRGTQLVA